MMRRILCIYFSDRNIGALGWSACPVKEKYECSIWPNTWWICQYLHSCGKTKLISVYKLDLSLGAPSATKEEHGVRRLNRQVSLQLVWHYFALKPCHVLKKAMLRVSVLFCVIYRWAGSLHRQAISMPLSSAVFFRVQEQGQGHHGPYRSTLESIARMIICFLFLLVEIHRTSSIIVSCSFTTALLPIRC